MNISYNWLRDLVAIKMTPQELAHRLTFAGLAVEAIVEAGDDFVLELDLTSNRGDCLSHLGVAREVAVLEGTTILKSNFQVQSVAGRAEDFAAVKILAEDLCPRYAARVIRGVKIGPSPDWMVRRLEAIGQRSLNNVADITNYVLFELGQPLHAFDLASVKGSEIIVRRARAGEMMKTLDGQERNFTSDMLLICDAEKAVAIAGVMGGLETEITEGTSDVLLEAAYFTPASIRQTSRKLGLATEASKRFERGIDPENVVQAQTRASELICELAGGVMTETIIDVYPQKLQPVSLQVRPERIKAISGLKVEGGEIAPILQALGFSQPRPPELHFTAPTWRHDMEREEDLVEEVARIIGYEKIPARLPPAVSSGEYLPNDERRRALRRTLAAQGFDETINFSFISAKLDSSITFLPGLMEDENNDFITLSNSILDDAPRMRPSLLPGLLEAARHNFNQGAHDLRLFEIGRVFAARNDERLPEEREAWALLVTGRNRQDGVASVTRDLDFFDVKGAIEAALAAMGLGEVQFAPCNALHLQSGQAAEISFGNGCAIGYMGRLREEVSAIYKFRQPVYLAELDLAKMSRLKVPLSRYQQLPRFPAIVRDLSVLVSRRVSWAELQQEVLDLQLEHFQSLQLVDVYEGAGISDQFRSITVRLEFRALTRTLRDEEAEAEYGQIVAALLNRFGAQQRA